MSTTIFSYKVFMEKMLFFLLFLKLQKLNDIKSFRPKRLLNPKTVLLAHNPSEQILVYIADWSSVYVTEVQVGTVDMV